MTLSAKLETHRNQILAAGGPGRPSRLLNTPMDDDRTNQVRIIGDANRLFNCLYSNHDTISFLPQGDDVEGRMPADVDIDMRFKTRLPVQVLDRRLLDLYRKARELEDEPGVSVLFLAVGFLRWRQRVDVDNVDWYAPLVLLPVDLTRAGSKTRFKLTLRDQDLEPNLLLEDRLREFGIDLPHITDGDNHLEKYFKDVQLKVQMHPTWEIRTDILILGSYTFTKFWMWRDLGEIDKDAFNNSDGKKIISQLLLDDQPDDIDDNNEGPRSMDLRSADLAKLGHVLDADASQTEVIAAAREGRNLVVQGPPGTGKSQTIANIIAVAVRDGKKVLFVSEKRAALEVVSARLQELKLGSLCLDLHDRGTHSRPVLNKINQALETGPPNAVDTQIAECSKQLCDLRKRLDDCTNWLHDVDEKTGVTRFGIIGELMPPDDYTKFLKDLRTLDGLDTWSRNEFKERCDRVRDLAQMTDRYGIEQKHLWRGVRQRLDTSAERQELLNYLQRASIAMEQLESAISADMQDANLDTRGTTLAGMPRDVYDLLNTEQCLEKYQEAATFASDVVKLCKGTTLIGRLVAFWRRHNDLSRRHKDLLDAFGRHLTYEFPSLANMLNTADRCGERAESLRAAAQWIVDQANALNSVDALRKQVHYYSKIYDAWKQVVKHTRLSVPEAFGCRSADDVPLIDLQDRLQKWQDSIVSLADWHRLHSAAEACSKLGLGKLRGLVATGKLPVDKLERMFTYGRAHAIWKRKEYCSRERYLNGAERTKSVDDFRAADDNLIRLAAQDVLWRHYKNLSNNQAIMSNLREALVDTRHLSLRKLLNDRGDSVAEVMPIFLMSPLSVAELLQPGGLTFDIVVIDEASQVRVADALGAIARSRQIVVVGDAQQLPPSGFFDRQIDEDAPENPVIPDILSLCDARLRHRMSLRWHYRSSHPSLIQVSNTEFYFDNLIYPPSPNASGPEHGLSLDRVNGVYVRQTNPEEAKTVANAVLEHARNFPKKTLGVVSLSAPQRDEINKYVDHLRRQNDFLDDFCQEEGGAVREPFFVKNLENVQGHERDVIFVSIGYGPGEDGVVRQNFGPISQAGGERRLNVLFTRSRQHCRVFSSIDHTQIEAGQNNTGRTIFRRFLEFAADSERRGEMVGDAAGAFEKGVAEALRQRGFCVDHQVGVGEFRVDLAVRDPETPGRYLIGIECDGTRYHASRWVRERDRLRQNVLEHKGWIMHRIWSMDWLTEPENTLDRLEAAVRAAQEPATQIPSSYD